MAELSDTEPAQLTIAVDTQSPDGPVVRLAGELDLSTADALSAAIEPFLASPPDRLCFDVDRLQFLDSSGLAVLVRCSTRVPGVVLRHPSTIVRRVIEAAGLSAVLPMDP